MIGRSTGSRYALATACLTLVALALAGPVAAQEGVTAKLNWSPTTPEPEETVTFDASNSSSDDANIVQYRLDVDQDEEWEYEGDAATYDHAYAKAGTYEVFLEVTDANEQTDTTQEETTVQFDADDDGVADGNDNCPETANPDQVDTDEDGTGDACDSDRDGDGIANGDDNCPDTFNEDQADSDDDGVGDACDDTPEDGTDDTDDDGYSDAEDNCPSVYNPPQTDTDNDGVGDACDPNPDGEQDSDGDAISDSDDECPEQPGPASNGGCPVEDQAPDADEDGVPDEEDNCPETSNGAQSDMDGDGTGDVCDETPAPVIEDTETRAERCQRLYAEASQLERRAVQAAAEGNESQAEELTSETEQAWTDLQTCLGEPANTPCGSISERIHTLERDLEAAQAEGAEEAAAEIREEIETLEQRLDACQQEQATRNTCQSSPSSRTGIAIGQTVALRSQDANGSNGWAFLAGDESPRLISVSTPNPEVRSLNETLVQNMRVDETEDVVLPQRGDRVLAPRADASPGGTAGSQATPGAPWALVPLAHGSQTAPGASWALVSPADGRVLGGNGPDTLATDGRLLGGDGPDRMLTFVDGGVMGGLGADTLSPDGILLDHASWTVSPDGHVPDHAAVAVDPFGGYYLPSADGRAIGGPGNDIVVSPNGRTFVQGIRGSFVTSGYGSVTVGSSGAIGEYAPNSQFSPAGGIGGGTSPSVLATVGPADGPAQPLMLPGTPDQAAHQARTLAETYDRVADCLAETAPDSVPSEECQHLDVRIDEAQRGLEAAQAADDGQAADRNRERLDELQNRRDNCEESERDQPNCLEIATSVEAFEDRVEQARDEGHAVSTDIEASLEEARTRLQACREDPDRETTEETSDDQRASPDERTRNETVPEAPEKCQSFQQQLRALQANSTERSLTPEGSDALYGDLWDCLEALFPGQHPSEYPDVCRQSLDAVESAKAEAHARGGMPVDDVDTVRIATLAKQCAEAASLESFGSENGAPGPGIALVLGLIGATATGTAIAQPRRRGNR